MYTAALLLTCVLLPVGASTVDGGSHIDVVDVGGCWCLLAPEVVMVMMVMVHCGGWNEMQNRNSSNVRT